MIRFINRLSVQVKMFFIFAVGLIGFSVYFSMNYVILEKNRENLENIVSQKMPAVEICDEVANSLETIHELATELMVGADLEGISKLDRANKKIIQDFKKWTELPLKKEDLIQAINQNYAKQYEKLNDAIQNMVAGLSKPAASKDSFNN